MQASFNVVDDLLPSCSGLQSTLDSCRQRVALAGTGHCAGEAQEHLQCIQTRDTRWKAYREQCSKHHPSKEQVEKECAKGNDQCRRVFAEFLTCARGLPEGPLVTATTI